MKNQLTDLNNHLFAQLERLSDEGQDTESLKREIDRSKAVSTVANQIIGNARLVLDAQRALNDNEIAEQIPQLEHTP